MKKKWITAFVTLSAVLSLLTTASLAANTQGKESASRDLIWEWNGFDSSGRYIVAPGSLEGVFAITYAFVYQPAFAVNDLGSDSIENPGATRVPVEYISYFEPVDGSISRSERLESARAIRLKSLLEKLDQVSAATVDLDTNNRRLKISLCLDGSTSLQPEISSIILMWIDIMFSPDVTTEILIEN